MRKRIIIASTIIMLMLFTFKVKAGTLKDNQVVQTTKSWTIHFNQEVSFDDLTKQGITVVDGDGTKVNITLNLQNDNKTIVVNPPTGGYKAGGIYKLIIGNKVRSKQNKNIKQQSIVNFSIEKSNEDGSVIFKDVNLEKVVRDSINKPTGVLYKKDLGKITYLDAQNKKIVYLDGIENLTNLVYIDLGKDSISEINSLESLSKLSYIDITDNPIKDISVLTKLSNLEHLKFGGNLFDVGCVKQIKNLKSIDGYAITDLNKFFTVYDKANEIIKAIIKPGMSDLEKEKAIHDYIVLNTKYDYDNYWKNTIPADDYSPYGILINGTGVCNGYAYAAQLMLNMAGIKCIVATGQANNGSWGDHAWNIVQIGGKNYQLDTTWDDPVPDKAGYVRYDYFNISDKELAKNHEWSGDYPKCSDSLNEDGISRDEVITFKDYNFEQVVRSALKKPTGDISIRDAESVCNIQYYSNDEATSIKDISGIEKFKNLEFLLLSGNDIENIEALKNLKKLRSLSLNSNKISNVDILSNLTNLEELDLSGNNISNINALNNLTKLKQLDMFNNKISNVDILSNLINLESLNLNGNNVSNIDVLNNLTKLKNLGMVNNKISNVDILSNLVNLESLRLTGNNISNINALNNLTKLKTLDIDNNKISNVDILSNLINLESLCLTENKVSNIDVLSKLNNITYLRIEQNDISNVDSLKNLTKLKYLYINGNPINQNDIDDLKRVLSNCTISY